MSLGDIAEAFQSTAATGPLLLAVLVSALAGTVSFASPCVIPLVAELDPSYPSVVDTDDGAALAALQAPPVLPVSYLVRADGSVERIRDPLVLDSVEAVRSAVRAAAG